MGSEKTASSFQSCSLAREGLPANRSSTEETRVLCSLLRSTPGAVLMSVFSSLSSPVSVVEEDILALSLGDGVEWYPVEKNPTADWIEGYAAEVLLLKRAA
jgi:hypothetical protein